MSSFDRWSRFGGLMYFLGVLVFLYGLYKAMKYGMSEYKIVKRDKPLESFDDLKKDEFMM